MLFFFFFFDMPFTDAFKMMDLDQNGYIERAELQLVVNAIYHSLDLVTFFPLCVTY